MLTPQGLPTANSDRTPTTKDTISPWSIYVWIHLLGMNKAAYLNLHVAFSSLARIMGAGSMNHSKTALFFLLFFVVVLFPKWKSAHTHSSLSGQESVHSGTASWNDSGHAFHHKLHISYFLWWLSILCMDNIDSQPTPTYLNCATVISFFWTTFQRVPQYIQTKIKTEYFLTQQHVSSTYIQNLM